MPDGSSWPRISVVTPSYNQAPFLEQTIRSVLLQRYPNLEYILIDGGSTDGSVQVIHTYEPWLAYWISENDKGQSAAINKGWTRATGEILAWLNSDDYYAPGALASAALAFQRAGPGTGMVYGHALWLDSGGEVTVKGGRPFDLIDVLRNTAAAVGQPAAFLRADLVRQLGGLAEEFHMAMDWDLYNRIALKNRVVFVPEVWAFANDWSGMKTRSLNLGFGPDKLESLRRLYRRKDLPSQVCAVKNEALASAALWSAFDHRRAHRYFNMQKCFFTALRHRPWRTLRKAGGYHSVRMALGPLLPLAGAVRGRLRRWGL